MSKLPLIIFGLALTILGVSCSRPAKPTAPVKPPATQPKPPPGIDVFNSFDTHYWLCVEPADAATGFSWFYNDQNLARGFSYERSQGGWSVLQNDSPNGAFRINVLP